MPLIRPRLTEYHDIFINQESLDFAIPFLDEDIPLYVDPFLLWRSPSQADQTLHTALINSFNHLGYLARSGATEAAIRQLVTASECDEVGLGTSKTRVGKRIGEKKADEIVRLFSEFPEYDRRGFRHFGEIQFFVDGISKDRLSDIACSFLKPFLVDFTIDVSTQLGIPLQECKLDNLYDYRKSDFYPAIDMKLPVNPESGKPILLVPKRWLRFVPWIDFDDYFKHHCPQDDIAHAGEPLEHIPIAWNRGL